MEKVVRHVRDTSLFLPILLVYALLVLLVSPIGDFPLNDDWVYAKTVEDLLESGTYEGHPYTDALFVLQALWGYLWTTLFGFSFTVLRFSTIACAVLGAWGIALSVRNCGLSRSTALIAAGLFLCNPFILNLTYTFMTDVPFICLTALSVAAYLRFLRSPSESIRWVFIGSVLAALSYLVRQFGVFTSGAFLAVLVVDCVVRRDWPKWQVVVVWTAPWLFLLAGLQLLPAAGEGLAMTWDWDSLGWNLRLRVWNGFIHFIHTLHYQSYFLLPLIPLLAYMCVKQFDFKNGLNIGFSLVGFLLVLWASGIFSGDTMPFKHNLLYDFGVGPLLFYGMVDADGVIAPIRLGSVWWVVTCLTSIGAFIGLSYFLKFLRVLGKQIRSPKTAEPKLQEFFLAILSILFIMGLFNPGLDVIYDRYFAMASAPLIVLVLLKAGTVPAKYSAIAIILWCSVSLYQVQDYMEWNRARWAAVEVLHDEMGIARDHVNGGYEYNGWFTSDVFFEGKVSDDRRVYGTKPWWVLDDDYAISMVLLPKYRVEKTIPYTSWMGLHRGEILIQKRIAEDDDPFGR